MKTYPRLINARLTEQDYEQTSIAAQRTGLDKSEVIRLALRLLFVDLEIEAEPQPTKQKEEIAA